MEKRKGGFALMLLVEKFLKDKKTKCLSPVCNKDGLLSYALGDPVHGWEYHFIYYCWESAKNHPGYYNFKIFKVADDGNVKICFLTKDVCTKSWMEYFSFMSEIKKSILITENHEVAQTACQAKNMLWRSFLKTQDCSFASFFKTLPESFFQSVDVSLSLQEQESARNSFLKFLKESYYVVYNSWTYFLEYDVEQKFCKWFYSYIYENTRE